MCPCSCPKHYTWGFQALLYLRIQNGRARRIPEIAHLLISDSSWKLCVSARVLLLNTYLCMCMYLCVFMCACVAREGPLLLELQAFVSPFTWVLKTKLIFVTEEQALLT